MQLTTASQYLAGIMLLSVATVEIGGWYLTTIASGRRQLTEFQRSFARAGHGHAGMLLTLGLVGLLFADAADIDGVLGWLARLGVPLAAIVMPGGFFAASTGRGLERPNKYLPLVWVGATSLAVGVISLGIGVLTA